MRVRRQKENIVKMSTRRTLYKPATKEKVVTKEKRKPLSQGRLVTEPPGGSVPSKAPTRIQQGTSNDGVRATSAYSGSQLSARVALTSSPTSASRHKHRADEAPRRETPHASMTHSPRRAEPSHCLDLSDADSDIMTTSQASRAAADSSILMVDASRQTCGANTSEVNISFGQERSPAKVICHAPSVVQSRLRDSGDVEEARRVMVDHMPSTSILGYSDYTDPSAHRPVSTFKSPLVVREHSIAGSPVDPHSTAKPVVSKNLFETILDEPKPTSTGPTYPQPRDMSMDNVSEASFESVVSDAMSDVSERAVSKSLSESATTEDQKKKRKGAHYPTSRYLQSSTASQMAKAKGPIKATDRSIMGSKNTSRDLKPRRTAPELKTTTRRAVPDLKPKRTTQTAELKPKKAGGVTKYARAPVLEPKLTGPLKPIPSGGSSRTTPQRPGSAQKSGSASKPPKRAPHVTSTPTAPDGEPHPGAELSWQHISHLTPDLSANMVRRVQKDASMEIPSRNLADAMHDSKMSSLSTTVSTIGSNDSRAMNMAASEMTQLQMDMLYARYLQTVYLESRARKSFKEQEKNIMAELYGMAELVTEKRKRKEELEHQVARLRHANAVDDALHLQETGLGGVVSGLEKLSKQYNTLSTALDTTRHQLPTRGVHIPDNEDLFIDQLQSALNESEKLLAEISVMSRQKQPKMTTFSETLRALDRTANEEVSELSKCHESLAAATTLTVQECSLLIQDMQLSSA